MTDAKRFDSDLQADMVRSVENYATQTAKAEVSDYEPDSWVQKVQAQAGTSTGDIYTLLLARQLIYAAEGQKDANGKTISGTKKAAAIRTWRTPDTARRMHRSCTSCLGEQLLQT